MEGSALYPLHPATGINPLRMCILGDAVISQAALLDPEEVSLCFSCSKSVTALPTLPSTGVSSQGSHGTGSHCTGAGARI